MPAALFTCCYSETLSPFKACSTNVGVSNYQRAVVSPGSYNTRPHSSATSSCQLAPPYIESSTDQITGIVDRELEAMFPPDLYPRLTFMEGPSFLSLVRSVVRREIADYGAPPPRIRAPCFAEYPISSAVSAPRFDRSPLHEPTFWRTPNDMPICFNCEVVSYFSLLLPKPALLLPLFHTSSF